MKSNIQTLPIKPNPYIEKLELYKDIKRQIKALQLEEEALKKEFQETIFLDTEYYVYNGRLLATYKYQERTIIDSKALEEEKPDIYEQFSKISKSRVLIVK